MSVVEPTVSRRSWEHAFYPASALAMAAVVFLGFAWAFYLRPWFHPPHCVLGTLSNRARALVDRKPRSQVSWICETTTAQVTWREHGAHDVVALARELFLVGGVLPSLAV